MMDNEITSELIIEIIRIYVISIGSFFTGFKIINKKVNIFTLEIILIIIVVVVNIFISEILKYAIGNIFSIMSLLFLQSIIFSKYSKESYPYSLLIITVSFCMNYVMFLIAIIINYLINNFIYVINKYINLSIISITYVILSFLFFKIKRFKFGFVFLQRNLKSDYIDTLILNISLILIFTFILIPNYNKRGAIVSLIIFIIIMFITIQKSLQLYYKQKMLVKDLEETKEELEEKNNKIKELEKEIIKSGKRSHSISHRQKILEHKLEELSMKSEISEMDIKSRIEKIGKEIRKEPVIVLAKTGIVEIDDVLNYMKSECLKKKIDFQLQLSGNIYKMINNYVSKDELEILLADHIKNAIIAIEYSENINKSILVRLGRLDGTYGLYVYDSGIEFEIETFLKLGKKPATTHKDSGGTGMGFMNTFDTLRKHNASFIIEEYGKPVTDNFTKVLKFKFDNKNEFKICTYRKEEIEKQDKEKILKVENIMF